MLKQVLSMSRLGGAGAVAQLVADVPLSSVEVPYSLDKASPLNVVLTCNPPCACLIMFLSINLFYG